MQINRFDIKFKLKTVTFLVAVSLFWLACSTEKNTSVTRAYHNLTSRFNVGFNGSESLKEACLKIDELPDNFTILLPIFKAEKEEVPAAVSAETERATLKAIKLIDNHSITVKPERKDPKANLTPEERKESEEFYNKPDYNNWVDDAYLMIGIAHYYKHDYRTGTKSFLLILNKFRKEEIRFDAMYWLARSYAALGELNDAETYLKMMQDDTDFPEKYKYDISLAYADILIKQKKYAEAVLALEPLIPETKKRKGRARLKYLSAQLYQLTNQDSKALVAYSEVIKLNPPYEMAFAAKINMAKSYSGTGDSEKLVKTLLKMLNDDKNSDFQDQIYYALAEIDMKKSDTISARGNYLKSTQKSVNNQNQKAVSFLALADIFFAQRNYLKADAYYDSTMSVLDKKHPDYQQIAFKTTTLSELVTNIETVQREDSLQKVAKMSATDRAILIEQLIARVKNEEAAANNIGNTSGRDEFSPDFSSETKGKWYFYNEQSLAIGRSEFKKLWGPRKFEDHWRRKNKAVVASEETTDSDTTNRVTDNKKPEFYLQNVPLNDSLMTVSHEKIAKALFAAGTVYERRLNDYPKAAESYKELLRRYPDHSLAVEALFNLYMLNFKQLGNKTEAEKYRQKILTDFPKSKYAAILSDPDYLKKLDETRQKIEKIYAEAYSAYENSNYDLVISKSAESRSVFEGNALTSKFLYLESMAYGSKGDIAKMKSGLETLVKNFPNDEATPMAKKTLEIIASGKYDADYYTFEETGDYYYEIITDDKPDVLNKIKFSLASFNVKVFPEKKLTVTNSPYDGGKIQIIVQGLSGKAEAEKFYNQLVTENLWREFSSDSYTHFVISKPNFEKLQKLQWTEKYLTFFVKNYSL